MMFWTVNNGSHGSWSQLFFWSNVCLGFKLTRWTDSDKDTVSTSGHRTASAPGKRNAGRKMTKNNPSFFLTMTDNKLPLLASFAAGMATVALFNKFVAQKKIDRTNGKWLTRE
jgi:hypothetical protein